MNLEEKKKVLIAKIENKKIHHKTKEEAIKAIKGFTEDIFSGDVESLSRAFVWAYTPQGQDFWSKIYSSPSNNNLTEE